MPQGWKEVTSYFEFLPLGWFEQFYHCFNKRSGRGRMDLFERNSLHLELPELVRSREDGAEEDGRCPTGAWAGSSGCPRAMAEARPAVRDLSGGASLPPAPGEQPQDSVLSEARRSKHMRTGVTKPDIKQGRGFPVPAKGVTMEGKGSQLQN